MGWKYAEDRRAYNRTYMRERRAWLKEHHMCTECKAVDALTMAGGKRCTECIEKDRRRKGKEIVWVDITEEKEAVIPREERRDYGLCYICGDPVREKVTDRGGICKKCYEHSRESWRKNNMAQKERGTGWWGIRKMEVDRAKRIQESKANSESETLEKSSPRRT